MKRIAMLAALMSSACAPDVSTAVNIAPSAEHRSEDILDAIVALNAMVDWPVFSARASDAEHRVDDQIVARSVADLEGDTTGECLSTRKGVIVRLTERCDRNCIMHELGHAAGLDHVSDPDNLMHIRSRGDRLDDLQLDTIRRIDRSYRERGRMSE